MSPALIGVAGCDENARTRQALIGISGEVKSRTWAGAKRGLLLLHEKDETLPNGNFKQNLHPDDTNQSVNIVGSLRRYDEAAASKNSKRFGDRAARTAWKHAVWFLDFTYLVTSAIRWRRGRQEIFGRYQRILPLYLDSAGFRRRLSNNAPAWAHEFENYVRAIALLDPDGFAAWDFPEDRKRTMASLRDMIRLYPDNRLWAVYSARWGFDKRARLDPALLPPWARVTNLASLIPFNGIQRTFKESTCAAWAYQALANAQALVKDPDFKFMADTVGRVMIGGLVRGPIHYLVRHLYAGQIRHLFPDLEGLWLMGQARAPVLNGLGVVGLLDEVSSDGTEWIANSVRERFNYIKGGLIRVWSMESDYEVETGFTLEELMASNLRVMLGAREGLLQWPDPPPPEEEPIDMDQVNGFLTSASQAQYELGF